MIFCLPASAHEGTTPFETLLEMKRDGRGPYSAPMYNRPYGFSLDWLGIEAEDVVSADGKYKIGVRIIKFTEDSLLKDAELDKGDILLGINDFTIRSREDLDALMKRIFFREEYRFTYLHDGDEETVEIFLDATLAEVDPKMDTLIKSKKEFQRGMLHGDFITQSPMAQEDSSPKANKPLQTPIHSDVRLPSGMTMTEMVSRSPLVKFNSPAPVGRRTQTSHRLPTYRLEHILSGIRRYLKNKSHLGITGDQEKKILALYSAYEKFRIKKDADIRILEVDLHAFLAEYKLDTQETESLIKKFFRLRQEKTLRVMGFLREFKNILLPEQWRRIEILYGGT